MGIPNAIDSLDKKYPTLIQKIKTQSIPAYKIELFLNSIEKNIDSIPLNKWNIVLQVCQTIQLSTQNSEQKQKSFDLIKTLCLNIQMTNRIRQLRKQNGLSQQELARRIGTAVYQVGHPEPGLGLSLGAAGAGQSRAGRRRGDRLGSAGGLARILHREGPAL